MAELILSSPTGSSLTSGFKSAARVKITYSTTAAGALTISAVGGYRTDSTTTSGYGDDATCTVTVNGTAKTFNTTGGYVYFNKNNNYKSWGAPSGSWTGLNGTYTITVKCAGTGNTNCNNATFTGSITVTKSSYTVSYAANGGSSTPSAQTKIHGTAITLAAAIKRADAAATAYTITYNANGGSCSTSSASAARTTKYTFSKWKATDGTTYSASASYTANASTTMTAQWTSSTSTAAVTLPTATRTGYTFKGWSTSSTATSGTTGSYTPSSNVTLYAIWQVNTYTVTYNNNGGSGTMSNSTATYNSSFITRQNTFTKDGYLFNGWNEAADGTGVPWALGSSGVYESGKLWKWTYTKSITLYAQWIPCRYVYIKDNGTWKIGSTYIKYNGAWIGVSG